jgi:N-acetylmuramoyl-L-alanine amidase
MGAQQDNLAVLRLSSMPGCLVECGFISTRDEENYMNSKGATEQYARGLFNAFMAYKRHHSGGAGIDYQPQEKSVPVTSVQKPQPKAEVKPEVKPVVKPEVKTGAQPDIMPEVKPDVRPEVLPETKTEVKPEVKPEMKPEVQPEILPEAKPESQPLAQPVVPEVQGPIFKVQIFASSALIKDGDSRFKGLSDIGYYKDGGMYKYTVGESADYNAINRLRREITDKFPQAFIIAFKDGARMDINQAINEFKKNKK